MPKAPRKRQPRMPIDARRDQILDAAQRLIIADGYSAASMEAIAREANLAKPRVYAGYSGRGQLLQALLEREEARIIATLADAMPTLNDDIDFEATLLAAASNLLNAVARDPAPWQILMVPPEGAPSEVTMHVAAGRSFALERLQALLKIGAATRQALSDLDIDLAARALLAIGEDAVRSILVSSNDVTPQRYTDFLRDVITRLSDR
jgi:AcrR family transcriptional regulator